MSLALLDWRRRVFEIYRAVRAEDDPARAHERWIAARDELFGHHSESPLTNDERRGFRGLSYDPYDEAYRFEVEVVPAESTTMRAETGTDGVVAFHRIGVVALEGLGSLDVWWLDAYGGGVFVPMADSSRGSYPGGRYILDTVKGADLGGNFDAERRSGSLVIDCNFAYQPSCAYDPAWACPLAPPGNRLAAPIEVGERYWAS